MQPEQENSDLPSIEDGERFRLRFDSSSTISSGLKTRIWDVAEEQLWVETG
jgi:hypothetical protein